MDTSMLEHLDDIEDMIGDDELSRSAMDATARAPMVAPKAQPGGAREETESHSGSTGGSTAVPGTQKIWLKTYGCSHNVSDSEYMQGVLASYGYRFTESAEEAQLWLLNSCTVKDPSQAAFMHLVLKGKAAGKAVVVAGCVPQADRYLKGLEDVSMVGIQQVDRVVEVVEETLKGHTVRLLSKNRLPELDLPKIRKNPMVEIIPLSTGCLGACTYCKTRHARGKLGSYTPDAIVARAQSVIAEGVTEIWLSSEDTGAYGIDIGTDLPTLLRALVAVVPEGVMLRVGMTNPPYILQHLDAVAEVLNHECVYSFLHVPVQAGSDAVLLAMNREYTVGDFEQVADVLLRNVPALTLATDIICGFPGESEEDFDGTLALVDKYKFHIMNISQFYPRPGTPAAKMRRVPTQVVKNRSRRLTKLFEVLAPYTALVGSEQKVWVNTEISDDQRFTVAHTKNYTKVLLPRDDSLMGCTAVVKITASARFHVNAEVVSRSQPVTEAAGRIRDQIIAEGRQVSRVSAMKALAASASAGVVVASITGGCGGGGDDTDGGDCCGGSCAGNEDGDGDADTKSGCCGKGSCADGASDGEDCCGGGCHAEPSSSSSDEHAKSDSVGVAAPPSALARLLTNVRDDPIALVAAATLMASAVFVFTRVATAARR